MGRDDEALKTLAKIFTPARAPSVLNDIKRSLKEDAIRKAQVQKIDLRHDMRFWLFVFLACAIAFFQQASGVNVMMYFAPVVLENVTGNTEIAMFLTIWVGVIQLIGTIIGSLLMDKVGRLPLMKLGSIGACVGLLITSYFIYHSAGLTGKPAIIMGYWTLFGMLFFMLFFAFSWSLGAWIIVSEIFPNRMRSLGMSFAIGALWVSNFIVGQGFPMMNENAWLNSHFNGAFPMWIFAGVMAVSYFFLVRFVPETNGIALEKMEAHVMSKFSHLPEEAYFNTDTKIAGTDKV